MALGVALVVPSLWAGLYRDDIPMAQNLTRWLTGESSNAWWDVFSLDAPTPAQRFGGRVPWWSVDEMYVRFFRPVAAATHLLDYAAWPSSMFAMHAHSVAWFGILVAATVRVYRRLLSSRMAIVAGAFFAASYVHAIPVGWLSNRNAVISAAFGMMAFSAFVRWRCNATLRRPWAPLLLLTSLLASEAGVATMGFVLAYELTDAPRGHRRGPKLLAMLLVVVGWRLAYSWAGFGALGSGGYIDPGRSPGLFLREAGPRFGELLLFLLSPMRALFVHGTPSPVPIALGVLFAAAGALVIREAIRAERRLWLIASALCMLPALAAVPGERLLSFAAVAMSPIVAGALLRLPATLMGRAAATPLVLTYGVVSPLVLALGSFDQSYDLRRLAQAIPTMASLTDEEVRGRNLFILHSPNHAVVHMMGASRNRAGMAPPAFAWNLFPSDTPPEITRSGCCALEFSNADGLSRGPFVLYFRGVDSPMSVGETVETLAFTAQVLSVTERGVPTGMRFTLKEPLESYRNVFVTWNGDDFERVAAESL